MALAILLMTGVQTAFSDTGSGESAAGFLTSLPPSAPTLKSPEDNAVQIMSSTVEWNQLDHATTYELQVSTDSDFINLISDETELISTTFDVPGLGGDLIYYWHVKGGGMAFKPKSVRQRCSVFFAQGIVKIRGFSTQLLKQ